jgi:hypothetical protein
MHACISQLRYQASRALNLPRIMNLQLFTHGLPLLLVINRANQTRACTFITVFDILATGLRMCGIFYTDLHPCFNFSLCGRVFGHQDAPLGDLWRYQLFARCWCSSCTSCINTPIKLLLLFLLPWYHSWFRTVIAE